MNLFKNIISDPGDNQNDILKEKLFLFYENYKSYDDFNEASDKSNFWLPIKSIILQKISDKKSCHILEFGVGKSRFSNFLDLPQKGIKYDVQDITSRNTEYLKSRPIDNICIGELSNITSKYDIIFSTFVWEHIYNPRESLNHLLNLLVLKGELIIISPRYDFPFYLNPSIKHYSIINRIACSIFLIYQRLSSIITGKPKYLINVDPAVFHTDWKRDYDAVHWVSYWDLKYSITNKFSIEKININTKGNHLFYKFYVKYLLLAIKIKREYD